MTQRTCCAVTALFEAIWTVVHNRQWIGQRLSLLVHDSLTDPALGPLYHDIYLSTKQSGPSMEHSIILSANSVASTDSIINA